MTDSLVSPMSAGQSRALARRRKGVGEVQSQAPAAAVVEAPGAEATDAELIQHYLTKAPGSASSFDRLYHRYERFGIVKMQQLLGRGASIHDVKDAASEMWQKVWTSAATFRGESQFTTWLHHVANSIVIDRARRNRRFNVTHLPGDKLEEALSMTSDAVSTPEEDVDRNRMSVLLRNCVAQLSDRYRVVFELSYFENLSCPQIAKLLEIREGTVKSRLYYARQKLFAIIDHFKAERFVYGEVDLAEFKSITPQVLSRLSLRGIFTVAALADLSWDELVESVEPVRMAEEKAREIIMQARAAHFGWKPDEPLSSLPDLTRDHVAALGTRRISTMAQLADLSWPELVDALKPLDVAESWAKDIVMQARAAAFGWTAGDDQGV